MTKQSLDPDTIGKRDQDESAPQAEPSYAPSAEDSSKPLLSGDRKEPARRVPTDKITSMVRGRMSTEQDEQLGQKQQQPVLLHQTQPQLVLHKLHTDRLHTLGCDMPINERLHSLQQGHCMRVSQQVFQSLKDKEASYKRSESLETDPRVSIASAPCQLKFNLFVEENTRVIDASVFAVSVPSCNCNEPCGLREYLDEQYDGTVVWNCANQKCMVWEMVDVDDLNVEHEIELYVAQGHRTMEELAENGDVSGWWAAMDQYAHKVDADAQRLLVNAADIPECECCKPCAMVTCSITGELFFVCQDRACMCVLTHDEKCVMANMDIGQNLKFEKISNVERQFFNIEFQMLKEN